jgi:hypothetical protein
MLILAKEKSEREGRRRRRDEDERERGRRGEGCSGQRFDLEAAERYPIFRGGGEAAGGCETTRTLRTGG